MKIGDKVRIIKNIGDDGNDHHPAIVIGRVDDVVLVTHVSENSLGVSHYPSGHPYFIIFHDEYELIEEQNVVDTSTTVKSIKKDGYSINYTDSQEIRNRVFERVMAYYNDVRQYSGEGICQCDEAIIEASSTLSDIADNIIKFEYIEEDL